MAVLVTGAAGFIGASVSRALIARGETVLGVDNLNDYYRPALKAARLAGLQTLISGSKPQNRMIFSVVPEEKVDPVIALLQEISGNLDAPATGIVFTLPVDRVVGLAPELGDEGSPI